MRDRNETGNWLREMSSERPPANVKKRTKCEFCWDNAHCVVKCFGNAFQRDRALNICIISPKERERRHGRGDSVQYEELLEVVTRAVATLKLNWPAETLSEQPKSKLDERFLQSKPPPPCRGLPFFPDLHTEVSSSTAGVKQTLASYLSPSVASSLKAPALPSKPLRTTSSLLGKGYLAADQADLLKELDEGKEVRADDVSELRRTADLCLRATKETARAIWLWVYLLDALLVPSGLFSDAVTSVVDRYQQARQQAAAFQRFLPRCSRSGAAGREQPHPSTSSSYRDTQEQSRDREAQRHSKLGSSKPKTDLRAVLQAKKASAKKTVVPCHHSKNTRVAAWKLLPNVSQWVLHTVEKVTEFSSALRRLLSTGFFPHLWAPEQALVMEQEVNGLLRKEAIEVVPPHDRESGFYSRYFIVPKKDGGSEDWFVTIDLKDAYFHISILPQHRKFLRFAFGGEAYQYRVLPFGLALSPRTFTKCVNAALAPLRLQGIRILNYIDDWLILAQSEQIAARNRDVVLAHMKEFGLRLNAKKSVLSPVQRTTYLGVVWDSTMMQAHLSPARIESILTSVKKVKIDRSLTVKQFQILLGLMAAASNVIHFGLLYMRPLQWWLRTKGFSPRENPLRMIKVTWRCFRALDMWRKPWFLNQGLVLGAPCRCETLTTDHEWSPSPWSVEWLPSHMAHHCLEMLAMFQTLKHVLPDLRGHHVLVHTGGLLHQSPRRLAHQILFSSYPWASQQGPRPGEWRLHPEVVELIRTQFGQAQVDLFGTQETLHHPAPLGLDAMLQTWPRLCLYAFPPIALVRQDGISLLLAAPFWPGRVWFSDLISLLACPPWEIPVGGHDSSPPSGVMEAVGVAPEGAQLIASGLSTEVVETILQSRAPSTRKLYAWRRNLFVSWCGEHQLDPVHCPVGSVMDFLQARFASGLTYSTLKVYVAAISALHVPLGSPSLGRLPLVSHFLCSVLRLRPPVRSRIPMWDLAVVLEALCKPPFEPLEEISDRFLSLKTAFLLAISSLKGVGDLQALSVATLRLLWPKHSCQLFVCFGPSNKGQPASKQTLSRWIMDAISVAYESSDLPSPLGVKAHSTRGMVASKAFLSGLPLQDICNAADWSTPLTFVRFYGLDLPATPGSSALSS
ncbi:hypothetical protein M9458_053442 [Cirrhinus mrigala]|uniref:ribonuclease H n=1 Tax=Cirrhinus mrigala TaxID=683832 RepID=A0ABD0MRP2_CIRMR